MCTISISCITECSLIVCLCYTGHINIKANSYFTRSRSPAPVYINIQAQANVYSINDYGKFQIKLILILPAKSVRV